VRDGHLLIHSSACEAARASTHAARRQRPPAQGEKAKAAGAAGKAVRARAREQAASAGEHPRKGRHPVLCEPKGGAPTATAAGTTGEDADIVNNSCIWI
jgi:hypothetical protein